MNDETTPAVDEERVRQLVRAAGRRAPLDSLALLEREDDATVAAVLGRLTPALAIRILGCMPEQRGTQLSATLSSHTGQQWEVNLGYPPDTVGRIMEPAAYLFGARQPVAEVVEALRQTAQDAQLTYVYVVDEERHLQGVVAMRELLFAQPGSLLADVMIDQPFYFRADTPLEEATRAVLRRHYPLYPVCDASNAIVGMVYGYALFERQALALSAQPGRMVGVVKEEHIGTPWFTCLLLRHPWLQLNLLTAFIAGGVVGLFEDTIARVVALAAFLPVLAGQSGNTGCQALAVTLRGITLNELKPGMQRKLLLKETLLGSCNGALVGVTAGIAMYVYATITGNASPLLLSAVVLMAMFGSCVVSGVTGALVPLGLRRLGTDPATASTIFLTTATDVVSMGLMLALATLLV